MNTYETKQESKKEKYLRMSEAAKQKSDNYSETSRNAVKHIPFGQPILVGHHSESKHRNAIKRAQSAATKAVEERDKAQYYANKAASVGTGGVSSDNPDAIDILKEKLLGLEKLQDTMKKANRVHRAYIKNPASLEKADLSDNLKKRIRAYKQEYSWEPTLFSPYSIKNNNANIRNVKERIKRLEESAQQVDVKKVFGDITYLEEDNRVQLIFNYKPEPEIRNILKKRGFKWSPSRCAWVRMLNNAGRYSAQSAIEAINS